MAVLSFNICCRSLLRKTRPIPYLYRYMYNDKYIKGNVLAFVWERT